MTTPFRFLLTCVCLIAILPQAMAADSDKLAPEARGQKLDGKFHGPVEIWTSPDYRQTAGKYYKGEPDGKWTLWDQAGTKVAEITYRMGSFTGAVIMWHNSASGPRMRGKLKMRGSFNDGWWQGSVLTYYPNGKVRCERNYANGEITSAYAYQPRGKEISKKEAMKIALKDEEADNAYVDAVDAFIRKWAG